MRTYYSADYILPVGSLPLKDGVVVVDEGGEILDLFNGKAALPSDANIQRYEGVIVPGFVNTHCHLELSYLKNRIPTGLSLIPFIKEVIKARRSTEDVFQPMFDADALMYKNGIVAVADISNTAQTKDAKLNSKLYYHTFIELICFQPDGAKEAFRAGNNLLEEFKPLRASISPHAPYSVCKELFKFISRFCGEAGELLSIHNQETEEENKFYRYKTGEFLDFYKDLGIDIEFFKPQARNSIQSFVPLLAAQQKVLLVHNTFTSMKDIYFTRRSGRDITWCFCPNANLYIEGRLPKADMFFFENVTITLGTDSLASNKNLCILSELKTIHEHFPNLSFTDTIKWATLNGAKFLGIDDKFGSIEKGKKPGLNLIKNVDDLRLTPDSEVQKLI
ncbi:amidohydrolase family protein [Desertivirga arenae]|uniref:amidohydrolase family protein n=1 Tax=Desertivirga arenae TaxID=2810309 RepID=UPI001A978159|nr:amidohydrolase family protein [Pedobacter sp. SYSU D00823]